MRPVIKLSKTKIIRKKETDEWVVKAYDQFGKRMSEADCFTNNKEDAEQTAVLMIAFKGNENDHRRNV